MYFKNAVGKVYITKEAVIVETTHAVQCITPKPHIDEKEAFLEFEYHNQVDVISQLEHLYKVFGK
ncbi:hypothetical protein [Enterococcus sp. AZ072]|uniref:hypothetical protein n=1 Tax=unclassified Enterococcus TaxID=2608891 RepID=UPI003D2B814E